jgi:hypothetical protein
LAGTLRHHAGERGIEHIEQAVSVQKHSKALSNSDQMSNEKQAGKGSKGGSLCSKRGLAKPNQEISLKTT